MEKGSLLTAALISCVCVVIYFGFVIHEQQERIDDLEMVNKGLEKQLIELEAPNTDQ